MERAVPYRPVSASDRHSHTDDILLCRDSNIAGVSGRAFRPGFHVFRLAHSIPERAVFGNMRYSYNVLSRVIIGSGPDPFRSRFPPAFAALGCNV